MRVADFVGLLCFVGLTLLAIGASVSLITPARQDGRIMVEELGIYGGNRYQIATLDGQRYLVVGDTGIYPLPVKAEQDGN